MIRSVSSLYTTLINHKARILRVGDNLVTVAGVACIVAGCLAGFSGVKAPIWTDVFWSFLAFQWVLISLMFVFNRSI